MLENGPGNSESIGGLEALMRTLEQRRHGKFKYPEGQIYQFELVDEVGVEASYPELGIGDYRYLLQHLVGSDGAEMIRATYYRKAPGKTKIYFAGQTALTAERKYWVALPAEALKRPWFKSLIHEASNLAKT